FVLFGLGLHLALRKFGRRGLFFAAPLWVTLEIIRTYIFSGFPWMLLGYALAPFSGLLQLATVTGVYGLSFVAAGVNTIIVYGALKRSVRWIAAAVAVIAILSFLPILGERASNDPIAVRPVQTNISLDQPWKKEDSDALMNELVA